MDEDCFPESEHLLTCLRKLKEVFDVCDEDSDGFIRPEHLVQLGSQFGQVEQVRTRILDLKVYLIVCCVSVDRLRLSFK